MEYKLKVMFCKRHGMTEHFYGYKSWECEKCLNEYFRENENESIRIIYELNINEVSI